MEMKPQIRISRRKIYPTPGRSYRVAWKWIYDVTAPDGGEILSGVDLLSIARRVAREAARTWGGMVIESWRERGAS